MTFSDKIAEFYGVKEKYDSMHSGLMAQQQEIKAKITETNDVYHKALMEDIEQGSKKSQSDLSRVLRQVEDYERQLADIQERIGLVEKVKTEQLRTLLPGLKEARDQAIQEAVKEIEDGKVKARELKAKYILFARDLNKPFCLAGEVRNKFLDAAHSVGVNDYDRDRLSLPTLNFTSTYEGRHVTLAPTIDEITEAYNFGRISYFVQLFEKTGEIMPEEGARVKLEKLKEAGEND